MWTFFGPNFRTSAGFLRPAARPRAQREATFPTTIRSGRRLPCELIPPAFDANNALRGGCATDPPVCGGLPRLH